MSEEVKKEIQAETPEETKETTEISKSDEEHEEMTLEKLILTLDQKDKINAVKTSQKEMFVLIKSTQRIELIEIVKQSSRTNCNMSTTSNKRLMPKAVK